MAIERISKYVTSDGKEHTSFAAAQTHEKRMEYVGKVAKVLTDQRIVPGSMSQVAAQIIQNNDLMVTLRDTLTKALDWKRHAAKK
jgi:hypothetical protein